MNHFSSFYRQIEDLAAKNFPSVNIPVTWDHLISPYSIELPLKVYEKAEQAISVFFNLSRKASYQDLLKTKERFPFAVSNYSALMAYDFHSDEQGNLHLVEINTNASGFLFAALTNCAHDNCDLMESEILNELRRSFEEESGKKSGPTKRSVAIVDDDLPNQKMFAEFLMYKDAFKAWGWDAQIGEASALKMDKRFTLNEKPIDLVYNRSTDFYFNETAHKDLKKAWETAATRVSPQPKEFYLLSDKERLVDFTKPGWLKQAGASEAEEKIISSVLIPTLDISDFESTEALWHQRKTLFFKPRQSFGGKSVYRGESVSKKVFGRLLEQDVLIQKYVPAQRMPAATVDPLSNWKFDIRFFVYRDKIQEVAARIYQGQVTNFASQFGGFTQIRFI
jgi:hypothetical protein